MGSVSGSAEKGSGGPGGQKLERKSSGCSSGGYG